MFFQIVKMAGPMVGPKILKAVLDQTGGFGGFEADEIYRLFGLNEDTRMEDGFERLDSRLRQIGAEVSATNERTMFASYNGAASALERLGDAYVGAKEAVLKKGAEDPRRRDGLAAACRNILSTGGAASQGRMMIKALTALNKPDNRSVLQEYARHLDHELFGYCAKMEDVVFSLEIAVATAEALREAASHDLAEMQGKGAKAEVHDEDDPITESELRKLERHIEPLLERPRAIRAMFEAAAAESGPRLRFYHPASRNYLTVAKEGKALSKDPPFRSPYKWDPEVKQSVTDRIGMPRVFLYRSLHAESVTQPVEYVAMKSVMFIPLEMAHEKFDISLDKENQEWSVVETKGSDGKAALVLKNKSTGQALDGIDGGRVYANAPPADHGNRYMWWQPMLVAKAPTAAMPVSFENRTVMFRHFLTGFALDGDGERAYAEDRRPDAGNRHMRWTLQRAGSTMPEPGDHLHPGEELHFEGGRRILRFDGDGKAELHDRAFNDPVWTAQAPAKTGYRLVIGEKGSVAFHGKDGEPVSSQVLPAP